MRPRLTVCLIAFGLTMFGGECKQTLDPDSPCFDEKEFSTDNFGTYWGGDGITREVLLQFTNLPEDICPAEHISVHYEIYTQSAGIDFDDSVTKTGVVYWGGFYKDYEPIVADPQSGNHFEGTEGSVGL